MRSRGEKHKVPAHGPRERARAHPGQCLLLVVQTGASDLTIVTSVSSSIEWAKSTFLMVSAGGLNDVLLSPLIESVEIPFSFSSFDFMSISPRN